MSRGGQFGGEFLDQVRSALPMSSYVSEFVSLRKAGKRFVGKCPLHPDTAPSFSVSDEDGLFFCFGCRKGGDIFRFAMEHEGISFPEAVEMLADRAGVALPRRIQQGPRASPRDRIFKINEAANRLYREFLKRGESEGLRHLRQRGISDEIIETFELGLTPPGWDPALRELSRQGFNAEQIEEAGLVKRRAAGSGFYDRFRSRITIPIRNRHGKLIGFGGRLVGEASGEGEPKYLNSPETQVYSKGKTLYGMFQAKEAIRAEGAVVVVEGYFDMIRLFQAGFRNVTASLGTALTRDQIRMVSGIADRLYLNYDPDPAGLEATLRVIPDCLEEGMSVRIVRLPAGMDPDDFVAKQGNDAYRERLGQAQDLPAFLTSRDVAGGDIANPEESPRVIRRILPVFQRIESPLVRANLVARLAAAAGTEDGIILAELKRQLSKARSAAAPSARPSARSSQATVAEVHLLKILIGSPEIRRTMLGEIAREPYEGLACAGIIRAVSALEAEGREVSLPALYDVMGGEDDTGILARVSLLDAEVSEPNARECLNTLKRRAIESRMKDLQQALSRSPGDPEKADALLREKQALLEMLKDTLEQEDEK